MHQRVNFLVQGRLRSVFIKVMYSDVALVDTKNYKSTQRLLINQGVLHVVSAQW